MSIPDALRAALKMTTSDRGSLCFDASFPGFAGHFPEQPVVPAAVLWQAAQLLAEKSVGARLRPVRLIRARFFRALVPGDTAELRVSSGPECRWQCRIERDGVRAAELEWEVADAKA